MRFGCFVLRSSFWVLRFRNYHRISGFCCRLYHPISGQRSRINEIQCDSARFGGKKRSLALLWRKFSLFTSKISFSLGRSALGIVVAGAPHDQNFIPKQSVLTLFTGNQSRPFREDSAGNFIKVKNVLGVISNTSALNVEAITQPQSASQQNQRLPPLALSHPVQLPTPVKVNGLHFYPEGYPTKLKPIF